MDTTHIHDGRVGFVRHLLALPYNTHLIDNKPRDDIPTLHNSRFYQERYTVDNTRIIRVPGGVLGRCRRYRCIHASLGVCLFADNWYRESLLGVSFEGAWCLVVRVVRSIPRSGKDCGWLALTSCIWRPDMGL